MTDKMLPAALLTLMAWLACATVLNKPLDADLESTLAIIAIKLFPLCIFLKVVLKENGYGLLVLTLVLMFYMGFSTMDCFAGGRLALTGAVSLGLELLLAGLSLRAVKQQPRGQGAL